ncbi:RDD family protein [Salinactinospora qingdaonensis]|uniref:RDD family protein n=1 Tax=Salinactinospora qingdaonensis TaxID=702744 RepID=A0ABP7FXN6_9ACTN
MAGASGGYGESGLVTGDAVVMELQPAGFASRMAAFLLDVLIQILLMVGALIAIGTIGSELDEAATAAVQITLTVLILVGYPVTFETLSRGRSLGKLAFGLRVVGTDGSPERFRQALARGLSAFVEIWLASGTIALIVSMINPNGRRVGDFLAGTLVMQERTNRSPEVPIMMPPHLSGWASSAELSRLTPEAAAMARQYVTRFNELTEQARYEMGNQVANTVAGMVAPPPPPNVSALEFLSAVLAERRRREEARLGNQGQAAPDQAAPGAPGQGPPAWPTQPPPAQGAPPWPGEQHPGWPGHGHADFSAQPPRGWPAQPPPDPRTQGTPAWPGYGAPQWHAPGPPPPGPPWPGPHPAAPYGHGQAVPDPYGQSAPYGNAPAPPPPHGQPPHGWYGQAAPGWQGPTGAEAPEQAAPEAQEPGQDAPYWPGRPFGS